MKSAFYECQQWHDAVEVWARSPLTVSGALHGLEGEKTEAPYTPHTILGIGSKQWLWFSQWYKNLGVKSLTLLFRYLASWDRNCLSLPLILKLTLLHYP
jgi:hypothetical protein